MAVIGDTGGVFELIIMIFGVVIFPISYHSFILRASRLMFFARTKDEKLFQTIKDPEEKLYLEKYNFHETTENLPEDTGKKVI